MPGVSIETVSRLLAVRGADPHAAADELLAAASTPQHRLGATLLSLWEREGRALTRTQRARLTRHRARLEIYRATWEVVSKAAPDACAGLWPERQTLTDAVAQAGWPLPVVLPETSGAARRERMPAGCAGPRVGRIRCVRSHMPRSPAANGSQPSPIEPPVCCMNASAYIGHSRSACRCSAFRSVAAARARRCRPGRRACEGSSSCGSAAARSRSARPARSCRPPRRKEWIARAVEGIR